MATKKRELIDTGTDERYVRREDNGKFGSDQVDVGRSSAADQRQRSDSVAKDGEGDHGDRPADSSRP